MRINRAFNIVTIALFILIGCMSVSAQEIRYNFLPGTDFAKYRTYKWARAANTNYPNQILDGQIMEAIDAQLGLKGLRKATGDDADLVVIYQAAVSEEKQWNSYTTGDTMWGYGRWGGWGGYGGMSSTTTTSATIRIGTINVDI